MFARPPSAAALSLALLSLAACGPAGPRPQTPRGDERAALGADGSLAPVALACAQAPLLELGTTVRGTTARRADVFHASCAYGAASPDAVYRIQLEQPSHVVVMVSGAYDTVVHLRARCDDGDAEVACNDDSGDSHHSTVQADLPAGEYYVVVDGYASGQAGFYTVTAAAVPEPWRGRALGLARVRPGEGASVEHTPGAAGVTGQVSYAKRAFTPRGLTRATTDVPAPRFAVEAVDDGGRVLAATETDEQGHFALPLAPGTTARVRALTRTSYLGNDIRVVSDPGTERPYEVSTLPFRVAGDERISLHANVGGVEPAGAFNILAQFVRYLPFIRQGFGRSLPPLYAFWRRSNNRELPQGTITAFLLDYHRHEGAFALQVQGGESGREDSSDSDQFDDPVLLHEFSHFVIHSLVGHYSLGGLHPAGGLYFPGQALDEGAATALGAAIAGDSRYWDTMGLEPNARVLDEDIEDLSPLPDRGIGSQHTAQALVWDLIDGADGLPDRDHDGVALGPIGLMRVYSSFRDDPDAFPAIHTVLERAIELRMITLSQAQRLVRYPLDHGFAFPLPTEQRWPQDLPLGVTVRGVVDGRSQPAPSGGRNTPVNGFDAVRTYRLRVPRRGTVALELAIQGQGTQASGSDLDLELYTRQLRPVARAATERAVESLRATLEPGTYIVLVRDGDVAPGGGGAGDGNRAGFTLTARQTREF